MKLFCHLRSVCLFSHTNKKNLLFFSQLKKKQDYEGPSLFIQFLLQNYKVHLYVNKYNLYVLFKMGVVLSRYHLYQCFEKYPKVMLE